MSEYGSDVEHTTSIHINHDIDIDDDGISSIVTFIFIDDSEDPLETRINLEGVTDELCDEFGDLNGYQHLYNIAHEFTRLSEKLRLICLMIDISPFNVQPPLISSYAAEMEKLQADKEIRVNWKPVGRIYEHLACYYLSSVGITAEIKDGAGYDLLCETPNGVFFKVEVK